MASGGLRVYTIHLELKSKAAASFKLHPQIRAFSFRCLRSQRFAGAPSASGRRHCDPEWGSASAAGGGSPVPSADASCLASWWSISGPRHGRISPSASPSSVPKAFTHKKPHPPNPLNHSISVNHPPLNHNQMLFRSLNCFSPKIRGSFEAKKLVLEDFQTSDGHAWGPSVRHEQAERKRDLLI